MPDRPTHHLSGALYGILPETELKQQLSLAYVQAVATAAACAIEEARVDYDGVDVTVKQEQPAHAVYEYPRLQIQLKCTSQESLIRPDHLSWQLEESKYNHLRSEKVMNPRILVIMACPADFTTWVGQDHDRLTVSHAAYWTSLRGAKAFPESQKRISVQAPRTQPFDVEQLLGIMTRIGEGGLP